MQKEELHNRILKLSTLQRQLLKVRLEAIQASDTQKGKTQLTAYVQAEDFIDEHKLRNHVKEHLPDYMVPSRFVLIEAFPTLPNGKIDRRSLAEIGSDATEESSKVGTPKTELEQKLAAIWEEILGFSPIGIHDNFFEIGGDSILSIQITSKARLEGIQIEAGQLFEHQSIADLASVVQLKVKKEEKLSDLKPRSNEENSSPDFSDSGLKESDLDELLNQI